MKILARQGRTDSKTAQYSNVFGVVCLLLWVLLLLSPSGLVAQGQEQEQTGQQTSELEQNSTEELEEVTVVLPDSHQMAMALATPGLREPALLDLAVAANVLRRARDELEIEANHDALVQGYLDDRAWLQMLVDRYGWVQPRSSVLDPAAWLVLEELQQHDFEDMTLVFPGRTPRAVLIYQVFQRAAERLAVANLPILLLEVEADAISIWNDFLQLTGNQESPNVAWKAVELAWFTGRTMPPPLDLDENAENQEAVKENIPQALSRLVLSAVDARPPDSRGLIKLRYSMLNDMPTVIGEENTSVHDQARDSLYLVSLIDGLHDGRYFDFTQGLLSITSRLLELPVSAEETFYLVDWLVTELPAISAHYAADFARVDPRLNAAIAAAYEVLLIIASSYENDPVDTDLAGSDVAVTDAIGDDPVGNDTAGDDSNDNGPLIRNIDIRASRAVLANAVAQLALLIPDMGYYFDTPVRARIAEEIDICISIAASLDEHGGPAMTRRQFDACMETLLQLADQETRLAELSGNMNGPFTTDTLRRELSVTPWQRINYGIGYLHDRYSTVCQPPASPLPNPLEWAVLATTMSWVC